MGKWKAGLGDAASGEQDSFMGPYRAVGDALTFLLRDLSPPTSKGQSPEVKTTTKSIFAGNKGSGMEVQICSS